MKHKKGLCTKCGKRPAMHSVSCEEGWKHLCCQCYITDGGIPADWHYGCMKAAKLENIK